MEKPISQLQSQQSSLNTFKLYLEQIMTTFQEQKWQYQQEHSSKIAKLQKQIQQKNQIITHLSKRLEVKNQQLIKNMKDIVNYRKIVKQLKEQFFKMGNVVNKIGIDIQYDATVEQSLKNIMGKSSKMQTMQTENTLQLSTFSQRFSPRKCIKFDINGYFKNIKQMTQQHQQNFYLKEEKTAKTKNTEENSLKDIINQTTCFKDLLHNQQGLYSMLKEVRSSQKSIKDDTKRLWKTSQQAFKQNNRKTVQ